MAKTKLLYLFTAGKNHPGLFIKMKGQIKGLSARYQVIEKGLNVQPNDAFVTKIWKTCWYQFTAFFLVFMYPKTYARYNPKTLLINVGLLLASFIRPIYLEHNVKYGDELKVVGRTLEAMLHHLTYTLLRLGRITHVCITPDILNHMKVKGFSEKHLTYIQNGYEDINLPYFQKLPKPLNETQLSELKNTIKTFKNNNLLGVLVGIGHAASQKNTYAFHGVQNILVTFPPEQNIKLLFIGPYQSPDLPSNVLCLPPMHPETLKHVYPLVDVGVAAFGAAAKNLTMDCGLKAREYLWNGLPIVTTFPECAEDIEDLRPYILNINQVDDLTASIKNTLGKTSDIKTIVHKHLSWTRLLRDI